MKRREMVFLFGVLVVVSAGLFSCSRKTRRGPTDNKLRVFVSVPPQAYFVERIGGERLVVEVLVGPGQEPHSFEPTLKQIGRLGAAKAYFRIGMPFEDRLCAKLPSTGQAMEIIDTRKGIKLHELDDHDGGGKHHAMMDPHIWLSPQLARIQSRTIRDALCRIDPAGKVEYRANFKKLDADLVALDAEIAKVLRPIKGKTFFVFHPAFGYFASSYGLKQKAVETGGKTPTLKNVQELIRQARSDGVKVIFVQPQFSRTAAETIATEIKGAVVGIDPLARDYIVNLRAVAAKVRRAFDKAGDHAGAVTAGAGGA